MYKDRPVGDVRIPGRGNCAGQGFDAWLTLGDRPTICVQSRALQILRAVGAGSVAALSRPGQWSGPGLSQGHPQLAGRRDCKGAAE